MSKGGEKLEEGKKSFIKTTIREIRLSWVIYYSIQLLVPRCCHISFIYLAIRLILRRLKVIGKIAHPRAYSWILFLANQYLWHHPPFTHVTKREKSNRGASIAEWPSGKLWETLQLQRLMKNCSLENQYLCSYSSSMWALMSVAECLHRTGAEKGVQATLIMDC